MLSKNQVTKPILWLFVVTLVTCIVSLVFWIAIQWQDSYQSYDLTRILGYPLLDFNKQSPDDIDSNSNTKIPYWNQTKLNAHGLTMDTMRHVCRNTYFNTIETTVHVMKDEGTVFIMTGDIHDMWIRDSTEQVMQYAPLLRSNIASVRRKIRFLFRGLILKQAQYIIYDPYANSYRQYPKCYNRRHQQLTGQPFGFVATRDFELDNGAYFIKLLYTATIKYDMDQILDEPIVIECVRVLHMLWLREQHHNDASPYKPHIIDMEKARANEQLEVNDYIGMIYTARRPSDNRVRYGYHIADNLFVHHAIKYLIEMNDISWNDETLAEDLIKLRQRIWKSVHTHGVYNHSRFGVIYCYETNGFDSNISSNCNMMDDANVPGLLSIPWYTEDEYDVQIFKNTVQFVLSHDDPYYFEGRQAKGLGSSHTRANYVWPIGLTSQGLLPRLSDEDDKYNKYKILQMIVNNTAGTLFMHESFHVHDSTKYSRSWFAWANSYFSIFGNCLNQFISMNDVERIVNDAIKIENASYDEIKQLKHNDYGFNGNNVCTNYHYKKPGIKEDSENMKAIHRLRTQQTDAAIIRIMKARKTLNHADLIAEVEKRLAGTFTPTPVDITTRIQRAIALKYVERDANDKQLYHITSSEQTKAV